MSDSSEHRAIIYWDKLVGRTWYGTKVDEPQSDVSLKICKPGITVKKLSSKSKTQRLTLPGRADDFRTKKIGDDGVLQPIQNPERLAAGQTCGEIWINQNSAKLLDLKVGERPSLLVVCESKNPRRYPKAGRYQFKEIAEKEVESTQEKVTCDS